MSGNTNEKPIANQVWSDLEQGLINIYIHKEMNTKRYMALYTNVFTFCTASSSLSQIHSLKHGPMSFLERRDQHHSDFVGSELYDQLRKYVTGYVTDVFQRGSEWNGEDLLRFYTHEWSEFRFSSKVVDGIFSYINRHWIKREVEEGNRSIFRCFTLTLAIWKQHLFIMLKDRIAEAALEQIYRERTGEPIPSKLIKGVVESYVELGIEHELSEADFIFPSSPSTSAENEEHRLSVYRTRFESKFLQTTREFYAKEAAEHFQQEQPDQIVDYMKKVENRLIEEEQRCNLYLHQSTQAKLAKCLEEVLIQSRLEAFKYEFPILLQNRRDADLARMYKLCDRVEFGLNDLRLSLENHIAKEGLNAITTVAEAASVDAKLYITTILQVHKRYVDLVSSAFKNEPGFIQALDKAATTFINKNAVTMKDSANGSVVNSNKSPELLAKYCDQLLRKSNKMPDEMELEAMLLDVLVVFKYIEDKDVFSKFYTKMFSKRLINEISASEDAEMSLINKLKQSCGFEYTNRMSKMINDVQVSKSTCTEFRKSLQGEDHLDLNILILSTGAWPSMNPTTFLLPQKLTDSMEEFKKYYDAKHNGRKLTWVLSVSRGELLCSAFGVKKIFTCTTAQMAVLMLFNDSLEYTFGSLLKSVDMDRKTLSITLNSLTKTEILKGCEPGTNLDYEDGRVVSLNMAYTNKKIKIDISKFAMRVDSKQENEQVQKTVDEDRKSIICACIVRIMKTRKTLVHQQLMTEVLQQLTVRFKPKVDLVKRCIGQMIEKEYMRRSDNQRDVYEYIS
ncbi:unnamed protein product [Auanema sp. JU1783]|nr:unnamed protein product [Auanema sp. JU1783]